VTDLTVAPWHTIDGQLVHAGPALCLFEYQIIHPDGTRGVRHRLVEPDSTRVVAVDSAGMLALIWHWRYPLGYPALELPSAPVEPDSDPQTAAQRALRDGCGLAAREWTGLGTITVATQAAGQTVHLYRATDVHPTPQPLSDGEQLAFALPYPAAVASAGAGAIQDAASIAALLHAEQQRLAGDWYPPPDVRPIPPRPHRV
jgi:hypothetical protein